MTIFIKYFRIFPKIELNTLFSMQLFWHMSERIAHVFWRTDEMNKLYAPQFIRGSSFETRPSWLLKKLKSLTEHFTQNWHKFWVNRIWGCFLAQNAQDVGKNHFFLLPTKKLTILQGSFKDFFFGFRLIRPKNYSLQNHMLNMYSTKMKLQYHQSYKPKRKFRLFILRL